MKEEDLDRQDMPRKLKDIIYNRNNQSKGVEKKKINKGKKKKLTHAAGNFVFLSLIGKKEKKTHILIINLDYFKHDFLVLM